MPGYSIRYNPNMHNALRDTQHNQAASLKATQRMQTGKRILKASDDIAGSMLVAAMNVDSRARNQGVQNLREAQAMVGVVAATTEELEAAVGEIGTLYMQAGGVGRDAAAIAALSAGVMAAWQRYAAAIDACRFNGVALLTGGQANAAVQFGGGAFALPLLDYALTALSARIFGAVTLAFRPICGAGRCGDLAGYGAVTRALVMSAMRGVSAGLSGFSSSIGALSGRLDALIESEEAAVAATAAGRSLIEDIAILPAQLDASQKAALAEGSKQAWVLSLHAFASDVAQQKEAFSVLLSVGRG